MGYGSSKTNVKNNTSIVRGDLSNDRDFKYGLCNRNSYCIDASYAKGITFEYYLKTHRRQLVIEKYKR